MAYGIKNLGESGRRAIARAIARDVDEFFDTYVDCLEHDERQARASLKPGEPLPARRGNRFITGEGKQRANEKTRGAVAGIRANIDKARQALAADMSAAPSEEAMRAIQAARALEHPGSELLETLESQYGANNYLAHRAIVELAHRVGEYGIGRENDTEQAAAALDGLECALGDISSDSVYYSSLGVGTLRSLAHSACDDFAEGRDGSLFGRGTGGAESDGVPDGASFSISW